ncbi:hypothetical protein M8818_004757 [Zalaria obscura]|uniref:Uncharacterized protein n=1 Tax=Zalaria obscura TaxID=2024903 RepID=A0ACC3SCI8_9PEZI
MLRSFTVDLPETPTSPRRRSLRPAGPAKKWTFNRRWKPEGEEEEEVGNDDDARSRRSSSADVSDLDASPAASARPLAVQKPRNQAQGVLDDAVSQEHGKFVRPGKLSSLRSVTAPPQLTLQPSPPSKSQPTYGLGIDGTLDKAIAQSTTPNTKLEAPRTPELPPTPVSIEYTRPDPFVSEAGAERSNDHGHITSDAVGQREDTEEDERRESASESDSYTESLSSLLPDKLVLESEATVNEPGEEDAISQTPSDPVESTTSDTTSESSTEFHEAPAKPTTFTFSPTLTDDSEDVFYSQPSTSPETLRRRRAHGTRSQRSSSPSGTSAASMASLYRISSTDSQRALTGAIMRKTCSIFLDPPAHLVALMLRIAATIANGAFAFTVHTPEGMHRRVPGSWDLSDDEDDWDIDDYGYPLDKDAVTRRIKRESWGVD